MDPVAKPQLGGYGRATVWLREHGLNTRQIADLLETSMGHVRQLEFRGRRPRTSFQLLPLELLADTGIGTPPGKELRKFLGIRDDEDSVELTPRGKRLVDNIQEEIEAYAADFWSGVRYEAGIRRLRALLPRVGRPAQSRRVSQRARIHELCAETHLHSGKTVTALEEGLRAYHLCRTAFHESDVPQDLEQIGRVARLLSQMFLLRREGHLARIYLELHRAAQERLGRPPRPEYHHQLAVLAFQACDPDADRIARSELRKAQRLLEETIDHGKAKQPHEVKDIGERHLPLLPPLNWEGSEELLRSQLRHYPAGDIHVGLNVATTAACGLSTDDNSIQQQALGLLDKYADSASGYLRLETNFTLLRLTPILPSRIRAAWARFALYENAYDDRDRFPRYRKSGG
jgi:hypothetical protein